MKCSPLRLGGAKPRGIDRRRQFLHMRRTCVSTYHRYSVLRGTTIFSLADLAEVPRHFSTADFRRLCFLGGFAKIGRLSPDGSTNTHFREIAVCRSRERAGWARSRWRRRGQASSGAKGLRARWASIDDLQRGREANAWVCRCAQARDALAELRRAARDIHFDRSRLRRGAARARPRRARGRAQPIGGVHQQFVSRRAEILLGSRRGGHARFVE